jgi:hypothetical protein
VDTELEDEPVDELVADAVERELGVVAEVDVGEDARGTVAVLDFATVEVELEEPQAARTAAATSAAAASANR